MPVVLICAPDPLSDELHDTVIWRDGVDRHVASTFEEALLMAVAAKPQLVVVDRDLPRAERLVADLRSDATTRQVSIVVAARGDMTSIELELVLVQAGANAIVRLPAGSESDERLAELMRVPARRATRVPVRIEFEGHTQRMETLWGSILDLSTTGMLVEASAPLEVGTDVDFRFQLPGDAPPVCGSGEVVRLAAPLRIGLRYYGIEGDGVARIQRFIALAGSPGRPADEGGLGSLE